MLPKRDKNGMTTVLWTVLPLVILLPTIYKFYATDLAGIVYLIGAMLTTLGFLYYGILFGIRRTIASAKSLMFASFAYLPLIWIFILIDWIIFR